MYYMPVLMSRVGFDSDQSVFTSLIGGGALRLGTIPAIFYIERYGGRFWAIAILQGFFIRLMIIDLGYLIPVTNTGAASGVYITGLIIYEGFFGSYACLTWVIPSEVHPTYLRSYRMTTSDVMLFLCSFIVTYNFAAMESTMTKIQRGSGQSILTVINDCPLLLVIILPMFWVLLMLGSFAMYISCNLVYNTVSILW